MSGIGLIAVGISCVCWGSNFLPAKKFDSGNGIYFQWVQCIGIYCVGLIVHLIRDAPEFFPLTMLGGALWCTGNMLCVPIIARLGLGIGLSTWGGVSMVAGWASGVTGMLGQHHSRDAITNWYLNVAGVVITIIAIITLLQVKSDEKPEGGDGVEPLKARTALTSDDDSQSDMHAAAGGPASVNSAAQGDLNSLKRRGVNGANSGSDSSSSGGSTGDEVPMLLEKGERAQHIDHSPDDAVVAPKSESSSGRRKLEGIVMALCAGFLFGINYSIVTLVQDKNPTATKNGLDHVYAFFSGIILASTVYFMTYAAYMQIGKNKPPQINPMITFPGFVSGVIWGIAQAAFFVATEKLSDVVVFPIISVGPPVIANLWGVFYLKEITGSRNLKVLGAFLVLSFASITCVMLSRS